MPVASKKSKNRRVSSRVLPTRSRRSRYSSSSSSASANSSDSDSDSDKVNSNSSEAQAAFKSTSHSHNVLSGANPPYSGKLSQPAIELFDWIIRPLPDVKGVCVEGQKKGNEDFWHSSAITDVKRSNYVKTASGTIYKLHGKMNKLCTLETGFSKNIVHAFAHGFPADWKKHLKKFYSSLEHSVRINDECTIVRGYSLKKLEGMHKKRKYKKRKEVLDTLDSILTPVGLVKRCNSAENFTTTRSGRLSLPPLAQWQGQRYIISTKANTLNVGFQTAMAENALLKDTSSFMKLRKNRKKSLYHKSLSYSNLECSNSILVNKTGEKQASAPTSTDCSHKAVATDEGNHELKAVSCYKSNPVGKSAKSIALKEKKHLSNHKGDRGKEKPVHSIQYDDLKDSQNSKLNRCDDNFRRLRRQFNMESNPIVVLTEIFNEKMTTRSSKKASDALGQSQYDKRNWSKKNPMTNDEFITTDCIPTTPDSVLDCSIILRNRAIPRNDQDILLDDKKAEDFELSGLLNRKYENQESDAASESKSNSVAFKDNSLTKRLARKNKKNVGKRKNPNGEKDYNILENDCSQNTPKSVSFMTTTSEQNQKSLCGEKTRQDKKGKKRNYCASPFSDDTGYSTEEQSCLKLQDSTPKSCHKEQARKRRKLSLLTVKESSQEGTWTADEKALFERALRSVDANSSTFWSQVSDIVSSKSEIECRQYHTSYLEQKTKNAPERKKVTRKSSGRQKGEPVRGGKGTLKRKEDLREYLKEQEENYEDNLFDSSPFVSKKLPVPTIFNIDFDKDDSEIFGSNHNFITPMTKNTKLGTPGTRVRAQLASTRKTPTTQLCTHSINETPVTVVRQVADKYIHTFMNQHRRNPQESSLNGSDTQMESTSSKVDDDRLPSKSLFSPTIVVYDNERHDDEEDEEEDNPFIYYWNEDGNE